MVDWNKTQVPKIKKEIIAKILVEIEKQGLSQSQVGSLVGMSRVNVNKILRETEHRVSVDQLIRIANGIGLNIKLNLKKAK